MAARVISNPLRWRADKLAKVLNLHEAERSRLRITTIGSCDLSKEERVKRRRALKRLRRRERRRASGAKPREEYEANSISRAKHWEALGMSRASWVPRRKTRETSLTPSILRPTAGYRTCLTHGRKGVPVSQETRVGTVSRVVCVGRASFAGVGRWAGGGLVPTNQSTLTSPTGPTGSGSAMKAVGHT